MGILVITVKLANVASSFKFRQVKFYQVKFSQQAGLNNDKIWFSEKIVYPSQERGLFSISITPLPPTARSEVKPGLIRSFSKIETEQENILMPVLTRNTNLNQKK